MNDVKVNFLIDLKPELQSSSLGLDDSGTFSLNISNSLRTSSLHNFSDEALEKNNSPVKKSKEFATDKFDNNLEKRNN